jgi:hypothetical protein
VVVVGVDELGPQRALYQFTLAGIDRSRKKIFNRLPGEHLGDLLTLRWWETETANRLRTTPYISRVR